MNRKRKSKRKKIRRMQAYLARTIFALVLLAVVLLVFFGAKNLVKTVRSAISGPEISGNSIKISKSGVISETVYEDFDTDSYSEDELKEMVNDSISEFNSEAENPNSVKLSKLTVKKDTAVLVMEYASAEVYSDFNNIPLNITDTDDGKKLTVNMDVTVILPSGIKDSSPGVELLDKKTAVIKEGSSDSYIIY